jgi:soluble lytic murein transglycosylase-like protein
MSLAVCRGRALDACLLAAVISASACASTGPGAPSSLTPEPAPVSSPEAGSRPETRSHAEAGSRPEAGSRTVVPRRRTPAAVEPRAAREPRASRAPRAPSAPRAPRAPRVPRPRTPADSAAVELALTRQLAHKPLALALAKRMRYPELADRVAAAVVYEAGRARINPSVLAAVLVIENAAFDTSAVSTEGAIGLMQVMPMHVGNYRCLSGDLLNVEANICHGARLLSMHLRRSKSLELALRRYNGCVRGRNTPRCQRYPIRVIRTASKLRREILVTGSKLALEQAEAEDDSDDLSSMPPDVDPDSSAAGERPAKCDSFLGCLRNRWGGAR